MTEYKKEMDDRCVILSKYNLVKNPRGWWMDSGATRHIFENKELFASFALDQGKDKIYMETSKLQNLKEQERFV